MKLRQARKIVKGQIITCRLRLDGIATVTTGGRKDYGESRYRKALRLVLRRPV